MMNPRNICGVLTTLLCVCLLFNGSANAGKKKVVKVLGMNVESETLSVKDKADLFGVLQRTLRAYPAHKLQNPPDADLTDLMMDLECIDMDATCLTNVGKKYKVQRVVYTQVDKAEGGYSLVLRVVSVRSGKATHQATVAVKSAGGLANAMQEQILKAFGKPPSKEPKPGTLRVKSAVPGAKIFVNGLYIGIGRIKIKRPPGTYSIRVTSPGYNEVVFNVKLKSGKTIKKRARLVYAKAAKNPKKAVLPPKVAATPLYEKWWFWASIGGGVLLTGLVAAAASVGDEDPGRGSVTFSVDPQNAWRDASIQGAAR